MTVMRIFSKDDEDYEIQPKLSKWKEAKFILMANNLKVGILSCKGGLWYFKYTDDFKRHASDYNLIVGFPDINKTYESEVLWPFFQIRIPGLKQPAIQEILNGKHIEKNDEVALLKQFGLKTIANPYKLVAQ